MKGSVKEIGFNFLIKREVERSEAGELIKVRWETIPQNRSRMILRSICNFKGVREGA